MKAKKRILFWLSFYSLFSAWKIVGIFFFFRTLAVILFQIFPPFPVTKGWALQKIYSRQSLDSDSSMPSPLPHLALQYLQYLYEGYNKRKQTHENIKNKNKKTQRK